MNNGVSWEQDAPTAFVLDQNNYNRPPLLEWQKISTSELTHFYGKNTICTIVL
ncbi:MULTISPECIES: hypothetical protein [unclassified Okeania]|uniref:hypothetical protein n=1 Tax=unclassified Okeania TaxID=2634635 RepID=UPI0013BB7FED|nr:MULTISPECIES: hypothetical protein [unclassified Okeania]NET16730.1 hypothetical protein [Okeania sp. SIO1H6]NET20586.1 hypothetical protein [Okeania sp. SIO1H5]NET25114.1 hypothetical protein [Okeania sp. SIO1I7]NET92443.1 hypothetical protein [Okeania sp. SIO1H2]